MTTKYQRDKAKFEEAARQAGESIEAGYNAAEKKADEAVEKAETVLSKVRKSPYTAAGVLGSILVAALWFLR